MSTQLLRAKLNFDGCSDGRRTKSGKPHSRTTRNHNSDSSSSTNPSGSLTSRIYHGNLFLYVTSLPPSILTPPPTVESLSPVRKRNHPQSVKSEPKKASSVLFVFCLFEGCLLQRTLSQTMSLLSVQHFLQQMNCFPQILQS